MSALRICDRTGRGCNRASPCTVTCWLTVHDSGAYVVPVLTVEAVRAIAREEIARQREADRQRLRELQQRIAGDVPDSDGGETD